MATNPTPTNDSILLALCQNVTLGCAELGKEIGLQQDTSAVLQEALDRAHAATAAVEKLKAERSKRRTDLRQRDRDGELVLGRCRLRLAMLFGSGFNAQWEAAGFPDSSTMVPEVFAKRLALLARLDACFTAKPEYASQDMRATAVICESAYEALSEARAAVDQNQTTLRSAVEDKNVTFKKLRNTLRHLIDELDRLLAADDARWRRFGLNPPASETLPEPVERVQLSALGHGSVQVQWPPAPHATRYHVQLRVMGTQEFAALSTVDGTETLLQDLPPGEFIEVRVIAANATDEATPCPPSTVVVR